MKKFLLLLLVLFGVQQLNAQITVAISHTNVSCNSTCDGTATATPTGGTPPYTYSWNPPPAFGPSPTGLCAGNYTVTVTDQLAATGIGTVTINQPTAINPGISAPSSTCVGTNVSILPNVTGGSMPYAYSWTFPGGSPPTSTSQNPNVVWNTAGTYTVTMNVMDAAGCTATGTFAITIGGGPTVTSTSIEASCNIPNGSGTVNATGNSPFTYNWIPAGGTNATATGLAPGNYSVDVTDAAGCITTVTVTVSDSCDFVWPGDANDDAVADNNDILDIGIANGATGTTRANATLNWIGQPSTPWGQTLLSGTDYKWVDCNGDGVIDPADTNAVIQNFGFTHNNREGGIPVYDASLPDLTITMGQNILASNTAGTMTIAFGTSSVPVSNFYGLAFTLNFDLNQIDASSFRMNENGTWLGIPGTDLMGVVMNNGNGTGSVQVALTRLDHLNMNGFGNIANLGFMTTGNLVGTGNMQNVNFTISDVTVIDNNENPQTVNVMGDSVTVADPVLMGISSYENVQQLSAYPNPFNESVEIILPASAKGKACEMILTDAAGRIVLAQKINGGAITLERGTLESGIYICSIRSEGQLIGNTKLVVN